MVDSGHKKCSYVPSLLCLREPFGSATSYSGGFASFIKMAPPPGIDPGPWASKAHVLATTQWRNLNSLVKRQINQNENLKGLDHPGPMGWSAGPNDTGDHATGTESHRQVQGFLFICH